MAAADITLARNPAVIESDTTGAIITKVAAFDGANVVSRALSGLLMNHGPNDLYLLFSVSDTPAVLADVATDNGQGQLECILPVNGEIKWLPHYGSAAHKCAVGTAVLTWRPE